MDCLFKNSIYLFNNNIYTFNVFTSQNAFTNSKGYRIKIRGYLWILILQKNKKF